MKPYAILFCCTGNICRSPTAEGVFAKKIADAGLAGRIRVDSAGTHGYHTGEPPDPRSQRAARARGYSVREVPDPYDGGPEAFDAVLEMLEDASEGLLQSLLQEQAVKR